MSQWTHITACLSVDTCTKNKKRVKKSIVDYISKAPKITGSEADADVYINLQHGHNTFTWEKGKSEKYQTCIVISIQGDLRDKDGETTKEEFIKFLRYIEIKYIIRDYSINIEDEYRDECIREV